VGNRISHIANGQISTNPKAALAAASMKLGKQRVRIERLALQFGVELHADEPRMVRPFDDFGQVPSGDMPEKSDPPFSPAVSR
jgi:hypothetical protein